MGKEFLLEGNIFKFFKKSIWPKKFTFTWKLYDIK
jgi:hypothetical protein